MLKYRFPLTVTAGMTGREIATAVPSFHSGRLAMTYEIIDIPAKAGIQRIDCNNEKKIKKSRE